jgi:hypothetical protein
MTKGAGLAQNPTVMPSIVLQQVSSPFARKNARGTLEKPVSIDLYAKHIEPPVLAALREISPDGKIYIWGSKDERYPQFEKISPRNSIVLFRRGKNVIYHGAIAEIMHSEPLALRLWGRDADGETWPLIFFLKRVVKTSRDASKWNEILGRKPNDNWQGMTAIYIEDTKNVQDYLARELNSDSSII